MSLRVKVELILFVTMVAVVGLGYGIQRFLILPTLNPLEEQVARKSMAVFVQEMEKQDALLDKLCVEWSVESGFVRAVDTGDRAYLESRLNLDTLAKNALSLVCVLDANRKTLWKSSIDLNTEKEVSIESLNLIEWPKSHALLGEDSESASAAGRREAASVVHGVYLTSAGPVLISSRAITLQASQKGLVGRLILGRVLDRQFISAHFDNAGAGVEMLPVSGASLSQDERNLLGSLTATKTRYIRRETDQEVCAYGTYPDITGNSVFLLRLVIYRNVFAKAYDSLRSGLLVQVGIGLTALVVLIVLFRRTVLNPLARLTTHTVAVAETNDLSSRLGLDRADEIGTLSREFDRMVGRLEVDRERQKRSEEALRESEERYILAVRGANDGLWDWNLKTNEVHYSTRWKSMLGYEEGEIGKDPEEWFKRIHPEDLENVRAALDAHLKGQSAHFESEHRMVPKGSDTYLWMLCRGLAVRGPDGEGTRMAGSLTDITLRKVFEEQLSHLALHDSLTALPNRTLLLDRLSQSLKHLQRNPDSLFAVLFLDLDRFKVINDGLGHVIGDRLLAAVAERLSASLRASDTVSRASKTVARFGGDEFVVLLDRLNTISDATTIAERIQEELRKPFYIDDREIFTTASVGIALGEVVYQSAEDILRNADTAMYRAKAGGKDRFTIFDSDMGAKALARVQLENDLRRAVDRKEFVVYYQPIISLTTGKIHAVEALVRWLHPERGVLPPIEFIPIAEETGMIVPIGEWVLHTACRQVRAWQIKVAHADQLSVNVNLAASDFSIPGLVGRIETQLIETGLSPCHLELEITETAIVENIDSVTSALKKLRDMRVQLAIDDFGTGYSSLSYLHRLPMNTLKIDRAFIKDLETAPESLQIVKTILLLAHALEVSVVAEGIENERQLRVLRDLGCGFAQGYLFSVPLDHEACGKLLASAPTW